MKMGWISAKAEMKEDWTDYLTMEELNFEPRIVDIKNESEKYIDV